MQVHSQVMGNKSSVPAKEFMELILMEEWHLTPQELDAIPYKRLQRLLTVRSQRDAAQATKKNLEAIKQDNYSRANGQTKRSYRSV